MATTLEDDLRELVVRRRILVVVGAGVSIGATNNTEAASWPGLLKLGAAQCRELNPNLGKAWETRPKDVAQAVAGRRSRRGFDHECVLSHR